MPLSQDGCLPLHRAKHFRGSPEVLRIEETQNRQAERQQKGQGRPGDDGKLLKMTQLLMTSLCLSFLTYEMGIIIVHPPPL